MNTVLLSGLNAVNTVNSFVDLLLNDLLSHERKEKKFVKKKKKFTSNRNTVIIELRNTNVYDVYLICWCIRTDFSTLVQYG